MPASLADRVLAGDPRAIARAISVIEDESAQSESLVRAIFTHGGRAQLIGVTGPPGAGKSTLVDRLAAELRRGGSTIGVLAVDPTSPFSGGAVLGDRLRMQSHATDQGVFIRSMATRGHLGGLSDGGLGPGSRRRGQGHRDHRDRRCGAGRGRDRAAG
jgi:LAO/AO transport system kinase